MNLFKSKFAKDQKGSFLPIFAVGSMMLVPIIGLGVDYTRLLSFKGKLQSASDTAVAASIMDGGNVKKAIKTADGFLAANLPKVKFESRRTLVEGKIVYQVRSDFETPLLALVGKPKFTVYAQSDMPNMRTDNQGNVSPYTYSERDIRLMKRKVSKALRHLPRKQQEAFQKQYDQFFSNLNKSLPSVNGYSN